MVPDMLRDRRRSSAENNFQLRVRKRSPMPLAASNFQLRVRKDLLDRIRSAPALRSAAEDNFQLRVRKGGRPGAERNFQLRVRKSAGAAGGPAAELDESEYAGTAPGIMEYAEGAADRFDRSLRRTLLDQIRDRRFGRRPTAENNFQLRIRRSAPDAAEEM